MKLTEDEARKTNAKALFEHQGPWSTKEVLYIEPDYFFRHTNGGFSGSHAERSFEPGCKLITRSEARRLALEWGNHIDAVAEAIP